MGFILNGDYWRVSIVEPFDSRLVDRTESLRVATTDPVARTVYISSDLHGEMLSQVLIHEIGHCVLVSYGLLEELHRMVKPKYWIRAEEWLCNFVADYGSDIYTSAYQILGSKAIPCVVRSRLIA